MPWIKPKDYLNKKAHVLQRMFPPHKYLAWSSVYLATHWVCELMKACYLFFVCASTVFSLIIGRLEIFHYIHRIFFAIDSCIFQYNMSYDDGCGFTVCTCAISMVSPFQYSFVTLQNLNIFSRTIILCHKIFSRCVHFSSLSAWANVFGKPPIWNSKQNTTI